MFTLGYVGEENPVVETSPGLTPGQASVMAQDVMKKVVIGSVVVFGLIYWLFIKK